MYQVNDFTSESYSNGSHLSAKHNRGKYKTDDKRHRHKVKNTSHHLCMVTANRIIQSTSREVLCKLYQCYYYLDENYNVTSERHGFANLCG